MSIKRGEIVLAHVGDLYLCADPDCGAVGNNPRNCPLCHSHVLSLAALVDRVPEPRPAENERLKETPETLRTIPAIQHLADLAIKEYEKRNANRNR